MLQLWPTISNGYQETPASDILKRHFHAGFRLYDTSVPGNGNQGHLYGTDLPLKDKRALIEYLKTL